MSWQPDPVWYFPAPHNVQLASATTPDPNVCQWRDALQNSHFHASAIRFAQRNMNLKKDHNMPSWAKWTETVMLT